MFQRISAIIRKELRHIVRDWQTLMIILLMPVIMMFLYGYALNMDIKDVPVLIENPIPSEEIRQIVASIDASSLFKVIGTINTSADPEALFRKYSMKAFLRFPPDFAKNLQNGGTAAKVQVLIDGSDPNVGTILRNAVEGVIVDATLKVLHIPKPEVIRIDQRVLYNPEQRSALYFVPGLIAIILLMISAMLTSLAITREKELGTLEQLLVSPVRPQELVIGKIVPYLFIAGFDGLLILLVGHIAFGVTIAGSALLLAFASVIYIFAALSIGLLVSIVAKNQQQAMMIVLPATMMPTIILSGFIFPLASFPFALHLISYLIPATYFLEIIRGIILKGVGLEALWKPMLALTCIGLFLVIVSVKKMKARL